MRRLRHPLALLGRRHGQRLVQRVGALLDVVRIDDQRLRQLARRAGEAAQDQHAVLVVARGDELLATRFMPSCRLVTRQTSAAR